MPRETTIEEATKFLTEYYSVNGCAPRLVDWVTKNNFPCNKEKLLSILSPRTYNDFLESLDIPFSVHGSKHFNRPLMLEELRFAVTRERSFDYNNLSKYLTYHRRSYVKVFGSFKGAMTQAGITNNHLFLLKNYTDYSIDQDPATFVKQKVIKDYTAKHDELIIKFNKAVEQSKSLLRCNTQKFFSIRSAYQLFGSYNLLLIVAGYQIGSAGMRFRAKDGHICDSREEAILDDFLHDNGFSHEKNVRYPNSKMTCDFVVGTLWIEYTGYATVAGRKYQAKLDKKRTIVSDLNESFITIQNVGDASFQQLAEAIARNSYRKSNIIAGNSLELIEPQQNSKE